MLPSRFLSFAKGQAWISSSKAACAKTACKSTKTSPTAKSITQTSLSKYSSKLSKVQSRYMSSHRPHGVYVPTAKNSEYQSFEFTEENWATAQKILEKYPPQYKNSATAPLLDLAQRQCGGWLPMAAMNKVANICEVAPMDVYEVATFYTMFNLAPIGKHFVQVCGTTPCHAMRAPEIMETLKKRLGVDNGGTTDDKMFTLLEVECLGACVNAPMMQINDDFYEDLTPESTVKIIDELAAGRKPAFGPQGGRRKYAEPYGGKTTLKETPMGPYAPYLDKLDADAAAAKKQ